MKVFRIAAVCFKIFSEVQNEIINGSGSRKHIITPYRLQDLFSGNYFILIFEE
jgi:hypothetical protein